MSLLRVTSYDNHHWALTPSDILTIETCSPQDRKILLGQSFGCDPKTMIRLMLSGQVSTLFLRNPAQRLADKLATQNVVRAWWRGSLARGGVGFARPSHLTALEQVTATAKADDRYDGWRTMVALRAGGAAIAWGVSTDFDETFGSYEAAIAKELGRKSSDEDDEVGGLDDDDDAHLDDDSSDLTAKFDHRS